MGHPTQPRFLVVSFLAIFLVLFAALVGAAESSENEEGHSRIIVLRVDGMTCGSCEAQITRALTDLDGVGAVAINLPLKMVAVEITPEAPNPPVLASTVTKSGYPARHIGSMPVLPWAVRPAKGRASGCGGGCCNTG